MGEPEKKSGRIVFIVLLAAVAAAVAAGIVNMIAEEDSDIRTAGIQEIFGGDFIASLSVEGVIERENDTYNHEWMLETISSLKDSKKNRGIALFIDSPGGTIYESDELYLALQDYKTSGRPVYVYQGAMAASGGYYISCAGDKIYANRNTLTGSIGVRFFKSFDMTELMAKLGIKEEEIISGKNKNMFDLNVPVTDEQRVIAQALTDSCYEQFTGIVAAQRNIPPAEVKRLADGRLYTARQALDCGLIDAVGTWESMLDDMRDNEFGGEQYKIRTFRCRTTPHLRLPFYTTAEHRLKSALSSLMNTYSHRTGLPSYLYGN